MTTADETLALVRPFLAGDWADGDGDLVTIDDKFTGRPVTRVQTSGQAQVGRAVGAAAAAAVSDRLSQGARHRILLRAAEIVAERSAELREAVAADTGFTVADVAKEVDRTAETLRLCAEEAKRLAGEVVPIGGVPGQEGRVAYTRLDPLGVVCAITPFNSPLNTVAHKVGPALAAGNAVVVKPAEQTPRSAEALVRVLLEAGLPPGLITTVYGAGETVGTWLTGDPRIDYYAFTGSSAVGAKIHAAVGLRRTQLEMGSLSSTVICADANLERASAAAIGGSFRKSGQVCTSVQRLYVERPAVAEVTERLARELRVKVAGDPGDPGTFIGPLISPGDAERVKTWIDEAAGAGAEVVTGGGRAGSVVEPTVLSAVPMDATIMRNEVFGPVILVRPFDRLDDAVEEINGTPYGLAAGIFTRDIGTALSAADTLKFGAVHINETSSSRVDLMPFVGVKASGFGGPEGPRYAVRDMSSERLITLTRP